MKVRFWILLLTISITGYNCDPDDIKEEAQMPEEMSTYNWGSQHGNGWDRIK